MGWVRMEGGKKLRGVWRGGGGECGSVSCGMGGVSRPGMGLYRGVEVVNLGGLVEGT